MYCNRIASAFKHFYILMTWKVYSSSDDALLVRAKRQKWIRRLDLYIITCDENNLEYPDLWL